MSVTMDREIPPMDTLAPLVDRVRELAQAEIGAPRQLQLHAYDDGDYRIEVIHKIHDGEHAGCVEGVYYEPEREKIEYVLRPDDRDPDTEPLERRVLDTYSSPVGP